MVALCPSTTTDCCGCYGVICLLHLYKIGLSYLSPGVGWHWATGLVQMGGDRGCERPEPVENLVVNVEMKSQ